MMTVSASISKTFIILVLFFFFLFIIPSSMAELEKTVKKTGAEEKDNGTPITYRTLDPNHPAVKPSHPGKPYGRGCRLGYNCRGPPSHKASPRLQ